MNINTINSTSINSNSFPYYLASNNGFVNFNGFELASCGDLLIKGYNYDDLGQVNIEAVAFPFQDGGIVLSYFTTNKKCTFELVVRANTEEELNIIIDDIKRNVARKEKNLDILVNGEYRRTLASCQDIKFNRQIGKNILMNVVIELVSHEPHFYLVNPISEVSDGQTTGEYNIDIQNDGTAESEYVVYIVFGVGNTGVNNISITKDGFILNFIQAINDGDVIIIDGERKDVFYNGNEIDYDGIFLDLELGSNPMQIDMDGTTHNYVVTTKFLQKYK